MMVPYFYKLIPVVVLFGTIILAAPWLALFALAALLVTVVATVGGLVWAIVAGLYALGRSVTGRSWEHRHATQQVVLNAARVGRGGTA
jgi:hypothetical protein